MGLNTLKMILEKKGSDFLDKFLNKDIIITEKLDTYRILFEKQEDKLVFFKKDNTPINLIERTLTNIWEDAIIELTTIIGDIKLPEGLRFGLYYTPVERPIRIPYTNIPKYILTDITLRKNNKVVESYEYEEVKNWASALKIGGPPIIYSGKLTEHQKETLLNYALGYYDKLNESNFAKIIENLFKKTYSGENIIEGIIIQNNKDLAQIVSYEFELLNEAYQKEEYPRDYYDLILLNLNNFLNTYHIPILESNSSDEMYLEIVSDIFNKFCEKNPYLLENINHEYLNPPAFGYHGSLNLLLIKNKKTLELLERGGKIYEALYRIIISSLRKPKKEFGLLTEEAVKKFNSYVYLIKNVINEETQDNGDKIINESADSNNAVINSLKRRTPSDLDNMRIIASVQKTFEPEISDIKRGKKDVAVYVVECMPFTNSQMNNIISINNKWKLPIILVSISNIKKIKGNNFVFSDSLIKAQLESIVNFNKDLIISYIILDSWNLLDLFKHCRPEYEPMVLITDKDKKSEFVIQLYFEDEVMGGRINADKNFDIEEMENTDAFQALRAIEDDSAVKFKNVTPKPIWNLLELMISEYKTWSGQFLSGHFQENLFL